MKIVDAAEGLVKVISHTGIPLSDQGSVFTGALARQVCDTLGIKKLKTTAYHPRGILERWH